MRNEDTDDTQPHRHPDVQLLVESIRDFEIGNLYFIGVNIFHNMSDLINSIFYSFTTQGFV